MRASEFEYRHHPWIIAAVFAAAYSLYNVDHVNVLATLPASNIYFLATALAGIGAMLLTWRAAPRVGTEKNGKEQAPFGQGPSRYIRNPYYVGWALILLGLSTFQSRPGFPLMIAVESIFLLRLVRREEGILEEKYGDRFREYRRSVPQFFPLIRGTTPPDARTLRWGPAFRSQAFAWCLVATLMAFAFTLSDPVGYAFAFGTLGVLAVQKLVLAVSGRGRQKDPTTSEPSS